MSERVSIEAEALQIGWVMDRSGHWTWFFRDGLKLCAMWSDNEYATYGALANADGDVLGRREFYSRTGEPVSFWIRARLRGEPLPDSEDFPAVQPPAPLRERILAEVVRLEALGERERAAVMPRPLAARLRAIVEGRPL